MSSSISSPYLFLLAEGEVDKHIFSSHFLFSLTTNPWNPRQKISEQNKKRGGQKIIKNRRSQLDFGIHDRNPRLLVSLAPSRLIIFCVVFLLEEKKTFSWHLTIGLAEAADSYINLQQPIFLFCFSFLFFLGEIHFALITRVASCVQDRRLGLVLKMGKRPSFAFSNLCSLVY